MSRRVDVAKVSVFATCKYNNAVNVLRQLTSYKSRYENEDYAVNAFCRCDEFTAAVIIIIFLIIIITAAAAARDNGDRRMFKLSSRRVVVCR